MTDLVGVETVRWANTHNADSYDRATTDYRILVSATGAFSGEEIELAEGTGEMETDLVFHTEQTTTPIPGRYIRFEVNGYDGYGGGLNEIEVFGAE